MLYRRGDVWWYKFRFVHTIRAWIARRNIAHIRLGRAVRVSDDEIARLIEHGSVPAVTDLRRNVV